MVRGVPAETGLTPSLQRTAELERPRMLGGSGPGLASPALAPLPGAYIAPAEASATPTITLPFPSPETLERVRRHPYVRLGLNGSFTSLWAGQLISLFGDRIHQLALAAAVLVTTGSAFATALVFVTATLPNLLFSPIAGTLVDRWDHKDVLVVSDLLRAATVLFIPIAIVTNILLVYPLVFILTTISIFFRPARVAILPQIVRPDELLTANSALWVGETLADVIGYPAGGALRRRPGHGAADRVLAGRGDLRRLRPPPEHDRGPCPRWRESHRWRDSGRVSRQAHRLDGP